MRSALTCVVLWHGAPQVGKVQEWRDTLWRASHGALHMPAPTCVAPYVNEPTSASSSLTASTLADLAPGSRARIQNPGTCYNLDVDALTWAWKHMNKLLARLLGGQQAGAGAGAPPCPGLLPPRWRLEAQSLLSWCCSQMDAALGLDTHPSKPLLWRLGGR